MIPVVVGILSLWRETYNSEENHALIRYELDLLKEKCNIVALIIASYKR